MVTLTGLGSNSIVSIITFFNWGVALLSIYLFFFFKAEAFRNNIVLTVIFTSLLLWIPVAWYVSKQVSYYIVVEISKFTFSSKALCFSVKFYN